VLLGKPPRGKKGNPQKETAETGNTHFVKKLSVFYPKSISELEQSKEQKIRTRVNYYVAQQSETSNTDLSAQFLIKTTEELAVQANDLNRADFEDAQEKFASVNLEEYFQERGSNFTNSLADGVIEKYGWDEEEALQPLSETEIQNIRASVINRLEADIASYNQELDEFIDIIENYSNDLRESPEMAEQTAYQIGIGNYAASISSEIFNETVRIVPSLRERIIRMITTELGNRYAKLVYIPSEDEHFNAFLPNRSVVKLEIMNPPTSVGN